MLFSSVFSWSLLAIVPMVTASVERVTTRLVPVVETIPDAAPTVAPFLVDGEKSVPLRLTTLTYIDAENSTTLVPVTSWSTVVDEVVQKSVTVLTVPAAAETAHTQRDLHVPATEQQLAGNPNVVVVQPEPSTQYVTVTQSVVVQPQESAQVVTVTRSLEPEVVVVKPQEPPQAVTVTESSKPEVVVVQPKESLQLLTVTDSSGKTEVVMVKPAEPTQEFITVTKSSDPKIVVVKPQGATSVVISYLTDTKVLTSTHWVTPTAQSAATVQGFAKVTVTNTQFHPTTITRVHLSTSYPPRPPIVTVTETASNPYPFGVGASHTPAPYYNHDAADGDPGGLQWAQGVHTNPGDRSAEFTKAKPPVWPTWGPNGELLPAERVDIKVPWLQSKKTTATTSGVVYGRAETTITYTALSTVEVTSVVDVTSTIGPRGTVIVTSTVQSTVEVTPTPSLVEVPVQEKHRDLKLRYKVRRERGALREKRSHVPGKWTTLSGTRSPPFPTYGPSITSSDAWPKPQMTTLSGTRKPASTTPSPAPAYEEGEEKDKDTVETVLVHGPEHTTWVTKPSVITVTHTSTHLTTFTVVVPDDDAEETPIPDAEVTPAADDIEARDFDARGRNVKVPRKYYDPAKYTLITGTRKPPFPTFGPPITWDGNWPKVSMTTLSGTREPPYPTYGPPLTWGGGVEEAKSVVIATVHPATTKTLFASTVTVTSTHLSTLYSYAPSSSSASASASTNPSRTMTHGSRIREEKEGDDAVATGTVVPVPEPDHTAPSPDLKELEHKWKEYNNGPFMKDTDILTAKLVALVSYLKHNFASQLAEKHNISVADPDLAMEFLQTKPPLENTDKIEAALINFEKFAAQGAMGTQAAQVDIIAEIVKFLCLFFPFCPPPETHPY